MNSVRLTVVAALSSALLVACGGGSSSSTTPTTSPSPGTSGSTPAPEESLAIPTAGSQMPPLGANKIITRADCTAAKLGTSIPASAIGEPVNAVTLFAPTWVGASARNQPYCAVQGEMAPIDPSAPLIKFQVTMPESWSYRGVHAGGGGMNGVIPADMVTPRVLALGAAGWGSDSGHQSTDTTWSVNEESMKNLGYMQMKKTRDAAMVVLERMYGEKPRFTYWQGGSMGGREGLTVAQRYPQDYDGIIITVPIVNFSTLVLAPTLTRIQEKALANWVPTAKTAAIRAEFIRQCDKLDGLADGVINNYMGCRAIFDVTQGAPNRNPWASKRCPDNIDPNPADNTATACFTDGQIATLKHIYSKYKFTSPLANGVTSFGMWAPTTDPSGSGLLTDTRYVGQEGALPGARIYSSLGSAGVTGFLMKDINANPLDYVEGGPLNARRVEISQYLDATNPDLSAFYKRGGKLIVAVGTNDSLASSGAQLDYYQSVLDKMGRPTVDAFARLWVMPQAGHTLTGTNVDVNGDGQKIAVSSIPTVVNGQSILDSLDMLTAWAEQNQAPGKSIVVEQPVVSGDDKSLPLCSYPQYPKYVSGATNAAASYTCAD